ncbi:Oxoglutarate iron-dependent oxygenase [Fusarium phyllophilum]|uniref:Oxoglutarate iron-dependent oxygenase n=1 Tax=Fusarium phyllophilum TaxID=47803 RepID=A0A8H5MR98_9HYPO|nr:Oxoglutarate iron-dependent oxygenase [Fusarium phyllophilum]
MSQIVPVRPAPQQATRTTMVSWNQLPPEIQRSILDSLYQQYRHKHIYAAVCSEWRTFMEERTFRTLRITQRRLLGLEDPRLYANLFGNLHHMRLVYPLLMGLKDLSPRRRAAIQHLWLNIELLGPYCPECVGYPTPIHFNAIFPQAEYYLYRLFQILSSWDCTERGLTLEFNAYCSLEQSHWLKNWFIGCPGESRRIPTLTVDERHCWRRLTEASIAWAIDSCFHPISLAYDMKLPLADAVTKFVIRRYCRNRFRPSDIARLVNACPRLLHLHLETWEHSNARDITSQNPMTGRPQYDLIANIHPSTLRTLTVFQDFCHEYVRLARQLYGDTRVYVDYRRWVRENTKQFAARSLDLEVLSVSFLIEAEYFFSDCQPDWTWKNLETIILTTGRFTHDLVTEAVSVLLQDAAQVALRMPRLETMVLWNAKRMHHATSFTYRRTKMSATIAWCSTVDLDFDLCTVRAWEEVARKHGQPYLWTEKRRIGRVEIISHGHAIRLLELPPQVIDPESRRQIEKEYEVARVTGVHCTPCVVV